MKALIAALMFVCASGVWAQDVMVKGFVSCGIWVKERSNKTLAAHAYQLWLLGFLSGKSMESKVDVLSTTENESLYLWVDNYCKQNPLKTTAFAGQELFVELVMNSSQRLLENLDKLKQNAPNKN